MDRRPWTAGPGRPGRSGAPTRGRFAAGGLPSAAVAAALTFALLPVVTGSVPASPAGTARADEVTASQDNLRTGWDPNEPGLSPSVVTGGSFGQLFSHAVTGQVYAQPIIANGVLIVATERNVVYGLDPATGAKKWSVSLGAPWKAATIGCGDLTPNVGITSTPVYDPGSGNVYVVAETVPAGHTASHPVFHLYAINAQTGAVSWKSAIGGAPTNSPKQPFHANTQLQRPALLLAGGAVYAGFGSHCDHKPYVGYVARVDVSSHKTTLWTDEAGVINNRAGIWQAGGGLMADGPNRIFFASGNGVSPAPGKGSSPPGQLAESVVRLGVNSNGSLTAHDFFSPKNAPALDAADHDLASGAPVGLPFGTTSLPNLLIQAGKTGNVFLLNRDSLGGREQGANKGDDTVAQAGPFGGQFGHVATFGDTTTLTTANNAASNDYIYYLGKDDNLRALRFHLSSGSPVLSDVANSTFTFAFSSGSPVVTSNGTDPASAIVWVDSSSGSTGTKARLDAFDAMPQTVSGSLRMKMIWSAPIGTASKFTIPATDSGRVYIGTRDGHVLAFGSTAPAAPLTGGVPVTFAPLPVTTTSTPKTVTVTATKPVTVTGTSVGPSSFSAGAATVTTPSDSTPVPVTFPVTLATGDALHVPVTYTPSAAGGAAGALTFATGSHRFPAIRVSLSGDGTSTGLQAFPPALSFPLAPDQGVTLVPIGVGVPQTVDITNGGTTTQTVASVTPPSSQFTTQGLPAPGTKIKPGHSFVVEVTYQPSQASPTSSSFTITNQDATSVTVSLSGSGTPSVSQLSASKTTVNFGSAPVGSTVTASVHITNTGNVPTIVTGTSALTAPFHAVFKVTKNMPFNPSYDLTVPVTFSPTKTGTFTVHYTLTWTDRLGTHHITVVLTGKGT